MLHKIPPFALVLIFLITTHLYGDEIRGFWNTSWSLTTQKDIETMVQKASEYNYNAVFIEIRLRGDALYYPNKYSSKYSNPEPRCHLIDPGLDVLDNAIRLAHGAGIEVHAWLTTYVSTLTSYLPPEPEHVYNAHPEWITEDITGRTMNYNELEGAYLDPGIPEVNWYLFNVFMDVVDNYDIDGIHFDYIRYPGSLWGYDPVALARFREFSGGTPSQFPAAWTEWRNMQVTTLVRMVYAETMRIKPWVKVSAAVFGDKDGAYLYKFQDWGDWAAHSYMDILSPMCYSTSTGTVMDELETARLSMPDRHVIGGLRAWDTASPPANPHQYPGAQIVEKVLWGRFLGLDGFNMFSLQGLRDNVGQNNEDEYFKALSRNGGPFEIPENIPVMPWKETPSKGLIYGQIYNSLTRTGLDGAVVTLQNTGDIDTTCGNGVFVFNDLQSGTYSLNASFPGFVSGAKSGIKLQVSKNHVAKLAAIPLKPMYELILDNDAAQTIGSWYIGTMAPDKYGADYLWTSTKPGDRFIAYWTLEIPAAGNYEIYAWWSQGTNRSSEAKYGIKINGKMNLVSVDQKSNGGKWNLLGTYYISEGKSTAIGIVNDAPLGYVVIADAIKLKYKF